MTLILPAPAKLNLFLHIIGRRRDGYHLLQTVFQLLDHGDELRFDSDAGGAITLDAQLPGVPVEDNLVYRAALALQRFSATPLGARIRLVKRLPSGAGLGGGSSDAATTLLGLNKVWNLGLDLHQLAAIGLQLGADVPVFVHGHSAWAEGVGDQLVTLELPECWYLVLYPGCRVDTGEIFSHRELTRNDLAITIRAFLEAGGRNSCQSVVEALYPEVGKARQWLDNFAPAQMTGTGSCLFARFDSQSAARRVLDSVPGQWEGFVASGVNVSPAHTALAESS